MSLSSQGLDHLIQSRSRSLSGSNLSKVDVLDKYPALGLPIALLVIGAIPAGIGYLFWGWKGVVIGYGGTAALGYTLLRLAP